MACCQAAGFDFGCNLVAACCDDRTIMAACCTDYTMVRAASTDCILLAAFDEVETDDIVVQVGCH